MSRPEEPVPAKLVVGVFLKRRSLLEAVATVLMERFGPLDLVSPWFDFDFTSYYRAEFGEPLFRRMLAFRDPVAQARLAAVKVTTNAIEAHFSRDSHRQVNIDPGYLVRERFVLATGKNFTHRIYLDGGIYADLTLVYQKGAFQALPWTYPDYTQPEMLAYLHRVRRKYITDLCRIPGKAGQGHTIMSRAAGGT
jgi:hypothetical protein